jgi:hypothetical protein
MPKKAQQDSSSDDGKYLEEWSTARGVLNDIDERLHDLRKYAFSFLTVLLTADSLLIPSSILTGAGSTSLPDPVKFVVLLVTLLLIVALQLIDRNYQVVQQAVGTRARILERKMNLELTEVITVRYRSGHIHFYVTMVYAFFIAGVVALGYPVLGTSPSLLVTLESVALAAVAIVVLMQLIKMHLPYGTLDWTVDRFECKTGDEIGITLTNLNDRKRIQLSKGETVWEIRRVGADPREEPIGRGMAEGDLDRDDNFTWIWKVGQVERGIYRIHRLVIEKKWKHLRRNEKSLKPLLKKMRINMQE